MKLPTLLATILILITFTTPGCASSSPVRVLTSFGSRRGPRRALRQEVHPTISDEPHVSGEGHPMTPGAPSLSANQEGTHIMWTPMCVGAILLIVAVLFAIWMLYRWCVMRPEGSRDGLSEVLSSSCTDSGMHNRKDVPGKLKLKNVGILLMDKQKLGVGANGIVWSGRLFYESGDLLIGNVAVKELVLEGLTAQDLIDCYKMIQLEIMVFKDNYHRNVVNCYGCIDDTPACGGKFLVVMERLPYTLHDLIYNNASFAEVCTYSRLIKMYLEITAGLIYLHEHRRVIHFDLKPANILLTNEWVPKLTDFGMSKLLNNGSVKVSRMRGTDMFMAPEVKILGAQEGNLQRVNGYVDIYSLGVLMLECTLRKQPKNMEDCHKYIEHGAHRFAYLSALSGGECDCPEPLLTLINECVQFDLQSFQNRLCRRKYSSESFKRPSLYRIAKRLNSMLGHDWVGQIPPGWC